MRIQGLKPGLALSCGLLAVSAQAVTAEKPAYKPFADADHVVYTFPSDGFRLLPKAATNLMNHGGGVIASPKVVFLFWGPSFNNAASPDYSYARTLQAYRNQLGSTGEWALLWGYGIQSANLGSGTPDWFDSSTPPINVTDSSVRSEVNRYFSGGHGTYNSSTIYEVVTPSSSYSSSGTSTSCSGPSLAYCSYHGFYNGTSGAVKYSIQPYPSCSGCRVSGWTDAQNQEHLVHHETCNTATDPMCTSTGAEVCDKCAWSPPPFLDGGYGYQYTWSSSAGACVKTR